MLNAKENIEYAKRLTGFSGTCFGDEVVLLDDNTRFYVGNPFSLHITNDFIKLYREIDEKVLVQKFPYIKGSPLDHVFTQSEAAYIYNKDEGTVRHAIMNGTFEDNEYKKSGRITLITKQAMERVYKSRKSSMSTEDRVLGFIREDSKLVDIIFDEKDLVKIVGSILKKYKITHTEVWQNPSMFKSIRVYNGPEDLVMIFFFKEVKTKLIKRTMYIFEDITLSESPIEFY